MNSVHQHCYLALNHINHSFLVLNHPNHCFLVLNHLNHCFLVLNHPKSLFGELRFPSKTQMQICMKHTSPCMFYYIFFLCIYYIVIGLYVYIFINMKYLRTQRIKEKLPSYGNFQVEKLPSYGNFQIAKFPSYGNFQGRDTSKLWRHNSPVAMAELGKY